MPKLMLVAFVVLATLHLSPTTEAFIIKTVSVQKAYPASLPSPGAAIGALTASKNALIQSVTNVVTEKINTLKTLVGSIVQAKIDAKTNLLRTAASASGGIVKSFNGAIASKPLFTKTITFGYKPLFGTTTAQSVPATTTTGAIATTTGQSSGGYARYAYRQRRHY